MLKSIFTAGVVCTSLGVASSQDTDSLVREQIAVTARTSADAITLRWAPTTFDVWQLGNQNGYRLERYVMTRNGTLLAMPEKVVLNSVIRPLAEAAWEALVTSNKYAAIAAQALYGDSFQLDLDQSDIISIVNNVQENEQRFAIALFAADMAPAVARASGLWYTDTSVKPGEKYLYRVLVNTIDSLRGSVFVAPENRGTLPAPQALHGEFREHLVSLKWSSQTDYYTAYKVERSTDGKSFFPISDTPLVTASPSADEAGPYQYALDSLPDLAQVYHYRVIGITPFGEESPPSAIVSGKGSQRVSQVPYILAAENINNSILRITWDFPSNDNAAITGFRIERAASPKEKFLPLTQNVIEPDARVWLDKMPGPVNYYRLKAVGRDGQVFPSPVYFAQLIDSIPPAFPTGFRAKVDNSGRITLSWDPNQEPDLFGYRIYKAYQKNEEPAQITTAPLADTAFTDQVDLHTLNEAVYYRLMALDINQNHSTLSPHLKVSLPDIVKPQPPVFLPTKSTPTGVALSWIGSASQDVKRYAVYRRDPGNPGWKLLITLTAGSDSAYHYLDQNVAEHTVYSYTVVAIDEAGLESDPVDPVNANIAGNTPSAPVIWRRPTMNREENRLTLRWDCEEQGIEFFRLYIAVNDEPPVLYKTLQPGDNQFDDVLIPGKKYTYRIMAQFKGGHKSQLSEPLVIDY